MNSIRYVSLLLVSISAAVHFAFADEKPTWDFEFKEDEKVSLASPSWHEKDYGWLLTGRLLTNSRYSIKPITYVRFEGLNAEEEVVWKDSKTIRRKDLSGTFGGQMEIFLRMIFREVPENVILVKAHFENGTIEGEE